MNKLVGSLEENVLTLLCHDIERAAEISLTIPASLYSTRAYRSIAEQAINYQTRYQRPAGAHIADLLEDKIRSGDEGKLIFRTIEEMAALYPKIQADYVMDQLADFMEKRRLAQILEKAAAALDSDDIVSARDALYAEPKLAHGTSGIYLHKPDQMLRALDQVDSEFFSTGIQALDQMRVRPNRRRMFLLIASKKRGKTWFLVNVGKHNLLRRHKILHITLEMPEEEVALRYIQTLFSMTIDESATIEAPHFERDPDGNFLRIDWRNIAQGDGEREIRRAIGDSTRREIEAKLENLKNKPPLFIKEFPSGSLTIAQLNSFLDMLATRDRFIPDLVLLDYPDLMAMDSGSLRIDTGRMYVNLRGLAQQRNFALCVVTQGNRLSETAPLVRSNMVGEDWTKTQTADTIVTLSRTEAEKRRGLARIFVEAARGATDGWIALISQAYATGQFCLDSVRMGKTVEEELGRTVSGNQS